MIKKAEWRRDQDFDHRHLDDVRRIQLAGRGAGYIGSLGDWADLWQKHSDSVGAGWCSVSQSINDILEELSPWFEDVE